MSVEHPTIAELFEDGRAIDEALRLAAQDALRFHQRMGHQVPIWRDGRVEWVDPGELLGPEPTDTDAK